MGFMQRHKRRNLKRNAPCVYFIQSDAGLVKIGKTSNIKKRMSSLQGSSPVELKLLHTIPCESDEEAFLLEAALHVRFMASRQRGEWFRPAPEMIQLMQDDYSLAWDGVVCGSHRFQ